VGLTLIRRSLIYCASSHFYALVGYLKIIFWLILFSSFKSPIKSKIISKFIIISIFILFSFFQWILLKFAIFPSPLMRRSWQCLHLWVFHTFFSIKVGQKNNAFHKKKLLKKTHVSWSYDRNRSSKRNPFNDLTKLIAP
jgi:hypothetical protein